MGENIELKLFGEEYEETPETLLYDYVLDFGDVADEMAKAQGMTHKDIAEAAGMKASTLSQILSGNSNPTVKTLERIALALDCKLESPKLVPLVVAEAEEFLRGMFATGEIRCTEDESRFCDLREEELFDAKVLKMDREAVAEVAR